MNKTDILYKLRIFKQENAGKYGILELGLFGSYSRGEANEESDIDIVINTTEPDIFNIVHIREELENILSKGVDIIRKRKNMNPYLKKRIENETVYV
ncbi:MAG: nucleotidyltransferase family protein [bacterium]